MTMPEKKETRNCGRNAEIVIAETHTPDEVCIVTYHIMANCVSDEPNSVIPWLVRKRAALFL